MSRARLQKRSKPATDAGFVFHSETEFYTGVRLAVRLKKPSMRLDSGFLVARFFGRLLPFSLKRVTHAKNQIHEASIV